MSEKHAPASRDAELSAVGCLLIEPETLAGQIFNRLQPEDFADTSLRTVYRAAREIWLEKTPLDPAVLSYRLGEGYGELLREAMAFTPSCQNWEAYCDTIADSAQLRAIQSVGLELINSPDAAAARAALEKAQGLLAPAGQKNRYTWAEMITGFMDRLEQPREYLDWGIPELNEQIKVRRGKFVILGAESSVGKTALALQLAFSLARTGRHVGFFSLETPQDDAADRMVAQGARIRLSDIKNARLGAESVRRAGDLAQATYSAPFELIEAADYSVEQIRAETLANGYDVIFLDYVQMLATDPDKTVEQVRSVSIALHKLAQRLGVTVVALSQITPPPKVSKGKPPKLTRPELTKENLRESKQLVNDADVILIMDLSDLDDYRSNRILKVDKNKDGPRARMLLKFDAPQLRFEPIPPLRDSDQQKADERNAAMDANRKKKQEKEAAKAKTAVDGQERFEKLPDDGEALPF
ncbi:MAG: AAA family ATPase [Oscillospiraceae bacterium]|nr:AAA family ATPase [Oscillospiraceae bacterium]